MPKVRGLTQAQRDKQQDAEWDDLFRRQVRNLRAVSRMSEGELVERIGVSRRTMQRRMDEPSTVTKAEERAIYRLCREYGIPYMSECTTRIEMSNQTAAMIGGLIADGRMMAI